MLHRLLQLLHLDARLQGYDADLSCAAANLLTKGIAYSCQLTNSEHKRVKFLSQLPTVFLCKIRSKASERIQLLGACSCSSMRILRQLLDKMWTNMTQNGGRKT
eukprot:TRINITY_DN2884_c0_g2_i1.p1 TRINITY_DN2884_c0_g2~~TRINITY_DN2884_c0_g2_i1.p1  ORF type:complete len:104 (+),score=11.55 TRINITY_DN2884_c0_g2_i1:196-507(+)